jgi:Sporulation and spore germination
MNPRQLTIAIFVLLAASLGMGLYAWHMQKRAKSTPAAYTGRVAPVRSGTTEEVTLYVADDASGTVRPQPAEIPLPQDRQQRAQEIIRALLNIYLDKSSTHPLAPGSDVRDVYLINPGVAILDMNSAFADGHRSGILVEDLTVASLVETVSDNIPGILRVKILVNGEERDTLAGHADLSVFYDVSAVNQMAVQMQSAQSQAAAP